MMTSVQLPTFIIHDHMYNAFLLTVRVQVFTTLTTGEKNASTSTLIYTNGLRGIYNLQKQDCIFY